MALMRLMDDELLLMYEGQKSVLILLNGSAAIIMADHEILLTSEGGCRCALQQS